MFFQHFRKLAGLTVWPVGRVMQGRQEGLFMLTQFERRLWIRLDGRHDVGWGWGVDAKLIGDHGTDRRPCRAAKRPTKYRRPHLYCLLAYVHPVHDVTTLRHAEKAIEAGVDGLILVAAGAGGHAGTLSPFALLAEVRRIFKGPIALSGSITTGDGILAARAMGADFAYIGTRFIASTEANADQRYKQMIVDSAAKDVLYTPFFTGIPGNYLTPSIVAAGLNPEDLKKEEMLGTNFGSTRVKPWKDIWGAGQGVGSIDSIETTAQLVATMKAEYEQARQRIQGQL